MKYILTLSLLAFTQINAVDDKPSSIDTPKITRTYLKDLTGYTQAEIHLANNLVGRLYLTRDIIRAQIKNITTKKASITDQNTPKTEYDTIVQKLKEAHEELTKIDRNIENYEIIIGKKSSKLVKTIGYMAATGAILTSLLAADYFLNDSNITAKLRNKYDTLKRSVSKNIIKPIYYRMFPEPYHFGDPNELTFFNEILQKWQPVVGNEELAKQYFVSPTGPLGCDYSTAYEKWIPHRALVSGYFYDETIGKWRLLAKQDMYSGHFDAKKIFPWLPYHNTVPD